MWGLKATALSAVHVSGLVGLLIAAYRRAAVYCRIVGCGANAACTGLSNGRTCNCNAGYVGDPTAGCSGKIDWVVTTLFLTRSDYNACTAQPCGSGSVCIDLPPPSLNRTCACPPGFKGDPSVSCTEINACIDTPCGGNTTCVDLPPPSSSRTCTCLAGYSGDPDVAGCTEVNGCLTIPCGGNTTCVDLPPPSISRNCSCNAGYVGDANLGCQGLNIMNDYLQLNLTFLKS